METKIKHLMSRQVVVANSNHKFSQVCEFFARFSVHHIPITEEDEVLGIISAKDVIKNFHKYLLEHDLKIDLETMDEELLLVDIMTKNPMTIHPDDTLNKAAHLFVSNKFHCLPVVEDGKVKGIITTKDIAKEVLLRKANV